MFTQPLRKGAGSTLMKFKNLIKKCRSYRRFYENESIAGGTLHELVDLARLGASAANLQPLKYILSYEPEKNALIFPALSWAGYLEDWPGPEKGERPSAYIIVLGDTNISKSFQYDCGIACQNIVLGAVEKGLGGCILGLIDREQLRKDLSIPEQYEILLVIAMGKPKEKVVLEEAIGGNIKYYRDSKDTHHVPKRPLDEIII